MRPTVILNCTFGADGECGTLSGLRVLNGASEEPRNAAIGSHDSNLDV